MGEFRNRDCMFCHEELAVTMERPVNLAFMDHVDARADCREAFAGWTKNMDLDFKGD